MEVIRNEDDFQWIKMQGSEMSQYHYPFANTMEVKPERSYYIRSDIDGFTTLHEDAPKQIGSAVNRTEDLYHLILRTGEQEADRKALDYLDTYCSSLYETKDGCFFLYKDRGTSLPGKASKMPDYVKDSICRLMGTGPSRVYEDTKSFSGNAASIANAIDKDFRNCHVQVFASVHAAETGEDIPVRYWQSLQGTLSGNDILREIYDNARLVLENNTVPLSLNFAEFSICDKLYTFSNETELTSIGKIANRSKNDERSLSL